MPKTGFGEKQECNKIVRGCLKRHPLLLKKRESTPSKQRHPLAFTTFLPLPQGADTSSSFHRLYFSIFIHIRSQIPVSSHPCFRIIHLQCPHQHPQRMSLSLFFCHPSFMVTLLCSCCNHLAHRKRVSGKSHVPYLLRVR